MSLLAFTCQFVIHQYRIRHQHSWPVASTPRYKHSWPSAQLTINTNSHSANPHVSRPPSGPVTTAFAHLRDIRPRSTGKSGIRVRSTGLRGIHPRSTGLRGIAHAAQAYVKSAHAAQVGLRGVCPCMHHTTSSIVRRHIVAPQLTINKVCHQHSLPSIIIERQSLPLPQLAKLALA